MLQNVTKMLCCYRLAYHIKTHKGRKKWPKNQRKAGSYEKANKVNY